MTKKLLLKALVINCTAIILTACVAHTNQIYVDPLRKNPKIVFRDLTVPPVSRAATGIYSSKGRVKNFKNTKTKKSGRQ